jgi:hypothetical protein
VYVREVAGMQFALSGVWRHCSLEPAVAYIADSSGNLDRWIFITTQAGGGTMVAFKTDR